MRSARLWHLICRGSLRRWISLQTNLQATLNNKNIIHEFPSLPKPTNVGKCGNCAWSDPLCWLQDANRWDYKRRKKESRCSAFWYLHCDASLSAFRIPAIDSRLFSFAASDVNKHLIWPETAPCVSPEDRGLSGPGCDDGGGGGDATHLFFTRLVGILDLMVQFIRVVLFVDVWFSGPKPNAWCDRTSICWMSFAFHVVLFHLSMVVWISMCDCCFKRLIKLRYSFYYVLF